jgi:hypothetical protein
LLSLVGNQIVDYVAGGARVGANLRHVPGPPVTSFPRNGKTRQLRYQATHGTWKRMPRSNIIAIKTCHRHCQHLVRFNFSVAERFLIVSCFIRSISRSKHLPVKHDQLMKHQYRSLSHVDEHEVSLPADFSQPFGSLPDAFGTHPAGAFQLRLQPQSPYLPHRSFRSADEAQHSSR